MECGSVSTMFPTQRVKNDGTLRWNEEDTDEEYVCGLWAVWWDDVGSFVLLAHNAFIIKIAILCLGHLAGGLNEGERRSRLAKLSRGRHYQTIAKPLSSGDPKGQKRSPTLLISFPK